MKAAAPRSTRFRNAVLGGAGIIAASILLASCSVAPGGSETSERFSSSEYGVPASPRVVRAGRRVPRGGGREIVGKPYRVAGRTYVPREDPNYTAVGNASWYGSAFHGRLTANGEVYDMNALSAAHPTMPLPSYARVTNTRTGESVVVRVNDRGPYHSNRLIDVSQRAAEMIGIRRAGIAEVRVDYLGRARLDGRDERMLMASYHAPGRRAPAQSDVMFASARPEARSETSRVAAADSPREEVQVAALRTDRARPEETSFDPFAEGRADAMFEVIPTAIDGDDPLGHLLEEPADLRSYAPIERLTAAQVAATEMATGKLRLSRATGAGAEVVVQVGVFGDPDNATRIAALMSAYGDVITTELATDARTLWSVKIAVGEATAEAALAAARTAGADGAHRVRN